MSTNNELHARALKEFGRGYLSHRRRDDVLSAIFERIDKAEVQFKEFEKWTTELCNALEYAEDYCVYEGRLDEDEKMTLVFEEWQAKAAGRTPTS